MNNQQKQQVIEQVKSANNVLVTVSANPTVDELSASVGLTLALNKLSKHATTVFSGVVPSTIEFLQPEQTIETTTDSLRDFIIALDKSKADKLRYKVEDDVVRIFITPYKTTITDKDLQFSHGDFNVDVVIAIGVTRREDLDKAVTAHGRILHDATIVSITRDASSELGSINWQEPQASSLCEMVGSMTLEVQQNVLDGQMATAFLTGIIAETDRFRNEKTSPLALSLSSQLMSSGANQQLIADKLEEPAAPPAPLHKSVEDDSNNQDELSNDGTLSIAHNDEVNIPSEVDEVDRIHIDEHGNLGPHPEEEQKHEDSEVQNDFLNQNEDLNHNSYQAKSEGSDFKDKPSESSTLLAPKNDLPSLHHQKKVIVPPSDEGIFKSDKPFDLNSAIQAANDEGVPVEAAPIEDSEPEPELPKISEHSEPPKIIQDHSGPMLTQDPNTKAEEGVDSTLDSRGMDEVPSGAPPPPLSAAAEHEVSEPSNLPPPQPISEDKQETNIPVVEPENKSNEQFNTSVTDAPIPIDDQTLTQLEKAVDSPHLSSSQVDDARDAVLKATDTQEPTYPKPLESVGASNIDLQKVAEEVAQAEPAQAGNDNDSETQKREVSVNDPTAPPPVPPPMSTPQFFDADGNNQNPFLNPNGQ